jgi:integrase
MRGHVQKKAGNWYVVLELERGEDGKRRQKWISVREELGLPKPATKKQAEELLTKKLKELQDGTYFEPAEITLKEYLNRWLEDYAKLNVRPSTYQNYKTLIEKHIIPALGDIPLKKLRPMHLQRLYADKLQGGRQDKKKGGLSTRTVRYLHSLLHEALAQAVKWELVARNVAEAAQPPRLQSRERQAWTAEQAAQFLEVARSHRLYPLYLLALSTGMRRGEILGLRWEDVDFDAKALYVRQTAVPDKGKVRFSEPKTEKSRRRVALSQKVIEVLKAWRQKQRKEAMALGKPEAANGLVFTSEAGTPINPRNLARNFAMLIDKAKLPPIPFHALRHTYATIMLREGMHPKIIQERLGHSRSSTTLDIYSHVTPDMQATVAERFDEILQSTKGGKKERTQG